MRAPAWQHDAVQQPNGTITFFDNGATPQVHAQSRAIVLGLNVQQMTASLLASFEHPSPPLVAASQGDLQALADGDWFVGWGQEPYFSGFAPDGQLLFDAHLPGPTRPTPHSSSLVGQAPAQPPAIAARARGHAGGAAYASWNGATAVAQWRVLGGSHRQRLAPLATAARSGFETAIALARAPRYLAVQALGEEGQVLGTSATITTTKK